MVFFAGIIFICIGYIIYYWRKGITHPNAVFFATILVYFPLKYFLVNGFGLSYSNPAAIVGNLNESGAVEFAGLLLFIYCLGSVIAQFLCRRMNVPVPVFSVRPRFSLVSISIFIALFLVGTFVALKGLGGLLTGLELRSFTQEKGMGYIAIIYELLTMVAFVQLLDEQKIVRTTAFLLFHATLGFLMGRSALVVSWILLILIYLNMVKRNVPYHWLLLTTLILPIALLLHGIVRVGGDILTGFDSFMYVIKTPDAFQFIAEKFIGRIDQLEEFSLLSQSIFNGELGPNPYWPLYFFVQFMPRAIWPDKPLFFNGEMMNIFYPDIFQAGVTFNFLGLGEMLYSFHIIGFLFAVAITGYLLHTADTYVKYSLNRPGIFIFFFTIPFVYLNLGFQVGWMNTIVPAIVIINLVVINLVAKVGRIRVSIGQ